MSSQFWPLALSACACPERGVYCHSAYHEVSPRTRQASLNFCFITSFLSVSNFPFPHQVSYTESLLTSSFFEEIVHRSHRHNHPRSCSFDDPSTEKRRKTPVLAFQTSQFAKIIYKLLPSVKCLNTVGLKLQKLPSDHEERNYKAEAQNGNVLYAFHVTSV